MSAGRATQTDRITGGLYNDILAGILIGDYPAHSTLPTEARLARDYGVSRSVVRAALEQLKRAGVVESRQGSGTVVSMFDPRKVAQLNRDAQLSELKDCFGCRLAIEPEIAAAVAQSPSGSVRSFLEDERAMLNAGDEGSDYDRSVRDAQFHIRLAEFSGNSFFVSTMNMLQPHTLFGMNIAKTLSRSAHSMHINLSKAEHLEIIDAILDRDADGARGAMRAHIDNGTRRLFPETGAELDVGETFSRDPVFG